MGEEQSKESNVKTTIDAVTGLVKAVPIYDDAIQPAAKQIGKSLETVTKLVNIALLPLKGVVWGYDQIESWINTRVAEKLKNVDADKIVTPNLQIAGPAVEALKYAGQDENLRELFANLLATAMNKETLKKAHPGYVDIIKNLVSDEASLLKLFINTDLVEYYIVEVESANEHVIYMFYQSKPVRQTIEELGYPEMIPSYFDNLVRLGLLEIKEVTSHIRGPYNMPKELINFLIELSEKNRQMNLTAKSARLTTFGTLFVNNIVKDNKSQ